MAYQLAGTEQTVDKCHAIKYQLFHEGCLAYYQLNMIFPDYEIYQHSVFTSLMAWSIILVSVLGDGGLGGRGRGWPPWRQGSVWEENENTWIGSPALAFHGHLVEESLNLSLSFLVYWMWILIPIQPTLEEYLNFKLSNIKRSTWEI